MATTEEGERTRNGLRSVEELAADAAVDPDADPEAEETDGTPQLVLPGTGTQLSTTVGGKKPTESLFKMSGVSLPIAGGVQVQKDTEMWVAIPVAIDDVQVRNRRVKGEIVGVSRTHIAKAIGQPIILDGPPAGVE